MKTGDVKNVTLTIDPVDTTDKVTAVSADDTVATVAVNADGGYDITAIKAGTVKITFASGDQSAVIDVTIADPETTPAE